MNLGLMPALNERARIGAVIEQSRPYLDRMIVCDDGSTDGTGDLANQLGAEVIRHPRTLGYGAALRTLFLRALELDPELAVTIDADGQHDPKSIPLLTRPVLKGAADIVIGSRFLGQSSSIPTARLVGIMLVTKLTRLLTRSRITDSQSGLRCYSANAMRSVMPSDKGMGASLEILFLACRRGIRIAETPIEVRYNGESDSSKNAVTHLMSLFHATFRSGLLAVAPANTQNTQSSVGN